MNSTPQQPAKKPYQKPSLKVYGDIKALTLTVATNGIETDMVTGLNKTV